MYREQPQPDSMQYSSFVNDIDRGNIKIPQFQREFVWSREESAKLIDSIIKGYPIGTFILWKTRENLRSIKNIGGIRLLSTYDDELQEKLEAYKNIINRYNFSCIFVKGYPIINITPLL